MNINEQELHLVVRALRNRAERDRREAGSRALGGVRNTGAREGLRDLARAADRLAGIIVYETPGQDYSTAV